jgi:hypothetical protein
LFVIIHLKINLLNFISFGFGSFESFGFEKFEFRSFGFGFGFGFGFDKFEFRSFGFGFGFDPKISFAASLKISVRIFLSNYFTNQFEKYYLIASILTIKSISKI